MNKKSCILLFLILFLGLSPACNRSRLHVPDGMLKPDEMVLLLVDIHLADGLLYRGSFTRKAKEDSAFNQYASILSKYKLTRAEFDSTIHFYTQHPDDFAEIYTEVLKTLSVMEAEVKKEFDASKEGAEVDEEE